MATACNGTAKGVSSTSNVNEAVIQTSRADPADAYVADSGIDSSTPVDADATSDDPLESGFTATRTGDSVMVTVPDGVWGASCGENVMVILKKAGGAWVPLRDERPLSHQHAGFYVEDMFIRPVCNLGCDVATLESLLSRQLDAFEYVYAGLREAPPDYEAYSGGPCSPPAETDAGAPLLSLIQRQSVAAELAVRIQYLATEQARRYSQALVPVVPK